MAARESGHIVNPKRVLIPIASLGIAATIGYFFGRWTGIGFWVAFAIVYVAMLINGWVATLEDEQPGGFNNPKSDQTKKEN